MEAIGSRNVILHHFKANKQTHYDKAERSNEDRLENEAFDAGCILINPGGMGGRKE